MFLNMQPRTEKSASIRKAVPPKYHLSNSGEEQQYEAIFFLKGNQSWPVSRDFHKMQYKEYKAIYYDPSASLFRRSLPVFVDEEALREFISIETPQEDPRIENLKWKLAALFESEPIEDGYNHPAEKVLENAIRELGDRTLTLTKSMVLDASQPSLGASVLRCLGRLPAAGAGQWAKALVSEALKSRSIEVRGAAIQAAENWGGDLMVEALREHKETVPWLNDYKEGVVRDLTGN
ncbi:MAG: hypothetical protein C4523_19735 [Myxococcales bacterium]|nr:MAG: hypothetical protein C4523_19735 [Myxococcales bacterium]